MKPDKIEELLKVFYDGKTTIEQERTIADYFSTIENIPEHLVADKEIFMAIRSEKSEKLCVPEGLEKRITEHIDGLAVRGDAQTINWRLTLSVAASVVVIVVSAIAFMGRSGDVEEKGDIAASVVTIDTIKRHIGVVYNGETLAQNKDSKGIVEECNKAEGSKPVKVNRRKPNKSKQQVSKEDIKAAQDALILVSTKLNKAIEQLKITENRIEEVKETIDKNINYKNEKDLHNRCS